MNTPNPATVFGRRRSPVGAELSSESPIVTAGLEYTEDESQKSRVINNDLGNGELPIAAFREQIVEAVDCSQATVITAETGAGKSTQVPQFLAEQGYEVIVTQPRVVAARSVAERVQDEVTAKKGTDFEGFVGYRTARERDDSELNRILFVTDGLQLVRELSGNGVGKKQALVLDEVHEWNENMEVLVAWAKQRMREDPNFKVVTMSATMEADKLSRYFSDENTREVPVIEVPGRTFEVKKSEGGDVTEEAIKFARDGKNTLVFVPGKQEIDEVIAQLERAKIPAATILPLHGQMEKEDQRKVFKKYPGVKVIVATNVAQTSITIDDIDAVVDSGLERQMRVKNSVEGLYLNPISQADCMQRAGRAGRTKEGEYVLAKLGSNPFNSLDSREEYGTPEILRTRLDGTVLRLAKNGFDAATMDFYNVSSRGEEVERNFKADVEKAKERLQKLGALREDGSVTKIGRDMDRLPVESHYARMMIEARKYGPEVQMQLAAILAVREAGGICQFRTKNRYCDERWRTLLAPDTNDSDLLKQLEVFIAAQTMSNTEKRNHDIYVNVFGKAHEVLRQLRAVEGIKDKNLVAPSAKQREQLLRCIIAGMVDNLYVKGYYSDYKDARGNTREASSKSAVKPNGMIVGTPFNFEINTRHGKKTINLIEGITNVPSVDMLREAAPQLFSEKHDSFVIDTEGRVQEKLRAVFNGQDTGKTTQRLAAASEARKDYLAREVASRYWLSNEVQQTLVAVADLNNRMPGAVGTLTYDEFLDAIQQTMTEDTATYNEAMACVPQFSLDDLVAPEVRETIYAASPDEVAGLALAYKDGIPFMAHSLDDDDILALDAGALVLADGRRVKISKGGDLLDVAAIQQRIVERRAHEKQEKQARFEADVASAIQYLNSGGTVESARQRYHQGIVDAAYAQYQQQQAERIAAERAAEQERQAKLVEQAAHKQATLEKLSVLDRVNDDLYDRTRLAGLEDAPEAIRLEFETLRDVLDTMKDSLERDRQSVERGYEAPISAYESTVSQLRQQLEYLTKQFMKWQDEQKQQAGQPVAAEDLVALMAKFNKR